MAIEYRVVFLSHSQMAPKDSTYTMLSNGGLVWVGEEGTFDDNAVLGLVLENDPAPFTKYNNRLMTEEEIYEYNNPPEVEVLPY